MGTVIVEQFNPVNGYWNKLYEVDESEFDESKPITVDKYGGSYRIRTGGVEMVEEIAKEVVEESTKKKSSKKEEVPKGRYTHTVEDDSEWDQM